MQRNMVGLYGGVVIVISAIEAWFGDNSEVTRALVNRRPLRVIEKPERQADKGAQKQERLALPQDLKQATRLGCRRLEYVVVVFQFSRAAHDSPFSETRAPPCAGGSGTDKSNLPSPPGVPVESRTSCRSAFWR